MSTMQTPAAKGATADKGVETAATAVQSAAKPPVEIAPEVSSAISSAGKLLDATRNQTVTAQVIMELAPEQRTVIDSFIITVANRQAFAGQISAAARAAAVARNAGKPKRKRGPAAKK
jgi:hypothetical protein